MVLVLSSECILARLQRWCSRSDLAEDGLFLLSNLNNPVRPRLLLELATRGSLEPAAVR
jgi:hypothetical protein